MKGLEQILQKIEEDGIEKKKKIKGDAQKTAEKIICEQSYTEISLAGANVQANVIPNCPPAAANPAIRSTMIWYMVIG